LERTKRAHSIRVESARRNEVDVTERTDGTLMRIVASLATGMTTGGILCGASGKKLTDKDIGVFIANVRLREKTG